MRKNIFYLLALALMFVGCEKDVDQFIPNPTDPKPITFQASAFVEVTDDSGLPVPDATINLEGQLFYTDDNGVAHLEDVDMHPATYLTVDKGGYFHGSRRFYPSPDKTHYVKVRLLPDQSVGSINASTGGVVNIASGVSLTFPSNAIRLDDGTDFTGTVMVSAQPIMADDPDLSTKMPGDLVGVSEEGNIGALASMGMMAVELRSSSGELLNIKDGSSVTMRMQVPSSQIGQAPATIPMWYFDEEKGVWIEDGRATLQGNEYVAEVGHFTYWNYDAWFDIVKWGAVFQFQDGTPASQVSVCVTILSMQATKCAPTNEDGLVCGMVASGEELLIEVKDQCGNVVFSEQIGPFSDSTMTGPYTIPETNVTTTTITGSVEDCDGGVVTNGFVRISSGYSHYVELEDDGTFSTTLINCNESDVVITAIDEANLKQSLPLTYAFAENIDAGVISACEDLTEYIDIELEGITEHTIFVLPYAYSTQGFTNISAQDSLPTGYFYMSFQGNTAGTYTQISGEIGVEVSPGVVAHASGENIDEVVITYFGEVGDYIIGTFSGTAFENPQQGGNAHPMTGTFSVIRN